MPVVPAVRGDAGDREIVGQLIVSAYARAPEHEFESVAVTVKLKAPNWVVVPDRRPLDEIEIPEGGVPDVTAYV